jgi:hypothetical protein
LDWVRGFNAAGINCNGNMRYGGSAQSIAFELIKLLNEFNAGINFIGPMRFGGSAQSIKPLNKVQWFFYAFCTRTFKQA